VRIAGDEVVETGRFIHVPEDWERAERNRRGLTQIVQISCVVLLVLTFLAGAVLAVVRWSRGRFARSTFVIFFAFAAILKAIQLANGFRSVSAQFVTAQPWQLQALIVVIGGLIATTAVAAATTLLVGLVHSWLPAQPAENRARSLMAGFGLGAAIAGLGSAASALMPSSLPEWPSVAGAADSVPLLSALLAPIDSWLTASALLLLVVAVLAAMTDGWQHRKAAASAVVILFGLVLAGSQGVESLALWVVAGVATGLVLLVVWIAAVRFQPAVIPLAVAATAAAAAVRQAAVGPFPGAVIGSLLGAAAVVALAVWWYGRLLRDTHRTKAPENEPGVGEPALEV
jgi:hypothetical protein